MLGTMKLLLLFAVFMIVTANEPAARVDSEIDKDTSDDGLRSLDPTLQKDDDISDEDAVVLLAKLTSENIPEDAPAGRLEKRVWRRRWRRVTRFIRRVVRVAATVKVIGTVIGKKR